MKKTSFIDRIFKIDEEVIDGGVVRDEHLDGYKETIDSNNIVYFHYIHPDYEFEATKEDNKISVKASGGNSVVRDGTRFKLEYVSKETNLLEALNRTIKKHDVADDNGTIYEVAGLPEGLGDSIEVVYESNEKIYKSSNQNWIIPEEASEEFYKAFHKNAIENGFDFTTDKSNVKVYDDADEEYLEGTWEGRHFGDEIIVSFDEDNIEIRINGELVDDTEYIIIDGEIKQNKKKTLEEAEDADDYEDFNGCSSLRKKNDFTITAYFTKNGYSTANLLKQKENQ